MLKMKIFQTILLIPVLLSCAQKSKDLPAANTVIIPAEPSKFGVREDCYKDRQTIKIVGTSLAKVLKAGRFGILDCYELGDLYQPCMLPDWAVEGTEVKVSGVVKAVFENERRAGTPFLINEINKP